MHEIFRKKKSCIPIRMIFMHFAYEFRISIISHKNHMYFACKSYNIYA